MPCLSDFLADTTAWLGVRKARTPVPAPAPAPRVMWPSLRLARLGALLWKMKKMNVQAEHLVRHDLQ